MNALWEKVNREMVAKILAELEYERTLRAERFATFDLFKPQIIRVILNPVKLTFSEHDGGSRMLPNYVTDLDNPLFLASRESAQ